MARLWKQRFGFIIYVKLDEGKPHIGVRFHQYLWPENKEILALVGSQNS